MSPTLQRLVDEAAEARAYGREHADGYIAHGEPAGVARAVAVGAMWFDGRSHEFAVRAQHAAWERQRERNAEVGIRFAVHHFEHTGGQS